MKKLLIALSMLAASFAVYANCTTQTIMMPDGGFMYCQTCCFYGNCTTTCM